VLKRSVNKNPCGLLTACVSDAPRAVELDTREHWKIQAGDHRPARSEPHDGDNDAGARNMLDGKPSKAPMEAALDLGVSHLAIHFRIYKLDSQCFIL
jgi:hypothetical protein